MPPSSKRRGRKREAETRRLSDADAPDSSPSRPATKKRRANNPAAARPVQPATPEPEIIEEEEVVSDGEPVASSSRDIAEEVIRHLAVAKEPVSVAIEWSNTNIERDYTDGVTAFAKVAGRDWTYYVKQLNVQIGRPSDAVSRQGTEVGARSSPAHTSEDATGVHIDLGPSKLISRVHAELFYDNEDEKWHVIVNGRNGVRVNDRALKRGQQTVITSGDVVEIAGTQMMFVTAEDPAVVHPMFGDRLREEANGEDVTKWNGQPHAHPEASSMNPVTTPMKNEAPMKAAGKSHASIAPAPPDLVRQATPVRSPRKAVESSARAKKSPPYGRGVMLETTEQINYALDSNKELKPPCSYATLIANAILSTDDEMLTLSGIYQWIMDNFAFYRHAHSGWQNSIRHNLSLNKAFEKIPRRTDEPGKGMKWRIVPDARPTFVDKAARGPSRGGRGSSAPNSPAGQEQMNMFGGGSSSQGGADYQGYSQSGPNFKASPRSGTPPMSSYPVAANEAYTPDRGPRLSNAGLATNGLPLLEDQSPLPARPRNSLYGLSDAAAGSPPTLSSSAYHDDGHNMTTPAPTRHLPRLAAPSTARLPSSYMPTSSPAPFWKFAENLSTPARPLADLSPLKTGGLPVMGGLQSSSPPPIANGSPSKTTNGRMTIPDIEQRPLGMANGGVGRDEDDDDMGGIDLARGFQPIGSFHKQMSNAAS